MAGQRYLLRVEYYQNHLFAGIRLQWSSPATPKAVIPQSQLYSVLTDTDHNGLPDLWELAYFGRIGVDPKADADGDGLTNLQEYQRWTNPLDPLDKGVPNEWSHGNLGRPQATPATATGCSRCRSTGRVRSAISGQADSFHLLYRPMDGNSQPVARVLGTNGLGGSGDLAKIGANDPREPPR